MFKALGILACTVLATAGNAASPAPAITVHVRDMAFDPQSTHVKVGDTVQFDNDDQVTHNVTEEGKGIASADITPGKTWSYTFTKSGVYNYVCTYHPWMKGEVDVDAGT